MPCACASCNPEFHGGERNSADAVEVVHAADVLVRDLAREEQFLLEPLHHALVGGNFRLQELQRDGLSGLVVSRFVDVAHASVSRFRKQFVALRERSQIERGELRRVVRRRGFPRRGGGLLRFRHPLGQVGNVVQQQRVVMFVGRSLILVGRQLKLWMVLRGHRSMYLNSFR
jgi:hypothetical protein